MRHSLFVLILVLIVFKSEAFIPRIATRGVLSQGKVDNFRSIQPKHLGSSLSAVGLHGQHVMSKSGNFKGVKPGATIRRLVLVAASWLTFFAKKVNAADAIKGWDLYGRVPHDDWLFTTWRLTNPDILRSSMTEAIANELPTALYAFRRRKRINELATTFGGVGVVMLGVLVIGVLYKSASFANSRSARLRAMGSVSAISKKGQKRARDIEEMGEGWMDMDDEDE